MQSGAMVLLALGNGRAPSPNRRHPPLSAPTGLIGDWESSRGLLNTANIVLEA